MRDFRLLTVVASVAALCVCAVADLETIDDQDTTKTGLVSFGDKVNAVINALNLSATFNTNSITFDNGAVIENGDTNTLTVTEKTLAVVGDETVGGTLDVTGVLTASSNLDVAVNATVGGTLGVDGNATLGGATSVSNLLTDVTANAAEGASGKSTVVSRMAGLREAVITFTMTDAANDLDLPDGAHGDGACVLTLPEGRIWFAGATIDATVTNSADGFSDDTNDVYYVAIGTAEAGDDDDLTNTEADIIAKTTIDTDSGSDLSYEWEADMTAGGDSVFDGTASPVKLYANAAIADASNSNAVDVCISGTAHVWFVLLGDD